MNTIIQFPKDRIVRPLRKRVARRAGKAAPPLAEWQVQARKLAVMMVDRAARSGQTLGQIHTRLRAAQSFDGDRLLQYTSMAMLEEVTTRLGMAGTIRMADRWPDEAREARLAHLKTMPKAKARPRAVPERTIEQIGKGERAAALANKIAERLAEKRAAFDAHLAASPNVMRFPATRRARTPAEIHELLEGA